MTPRTKKIAAAIGATILVVSVVVFAASGWLLTTIVRLEASRRGVELSFGDASVSGMTVTLTDVRASLGAVKGARMTATSVKVFVSGLSVRRVDVEGGALALSELDAAGFLAHRREHAGGGVKLHVRNAEATWGAVAARGVDVDHDDQTGGKARIRDVTVSGRSLGTVEPSWVISGETTRVLVPGRIEVDVTSPARGPGTVVARLPAQSLTPISPSLPALARVSGALSLSLPEGNAATTGDLTLRVDGYTPSVAREAASLVGARTDVSLKLSTAKGGPVELRDVKLINGSVSLGGAGTLSPEGKLQLALDGGVPCGAVAGGMVGGGVIGSIVGKALKAAITGTISIHLAVSADAKNPAAASATPTIHASCGL